MLVYVPDVAVAQTSWGNLTAEQKAVVMKKLSPEEQQLLRNELNRPSRELTPEALDALQKSPEFKNLKPEDIVQGKELLEKSVIPASVKPEQNKTNGRQSNEAKRDSGDLKRRVGDEETPTLFKRTREIGKYQDISLDLKPFGYDFFKEAAVRVVTERKDIPVPAKYIVGPGDEVKILLWGRVNAQYNLTVDRNGSITIPQIGPQYVAGMTFEQMSTHLIKQSNQIVGANIDITMGALKTIPIFVLGDVKRPGAYMIGSFATITDALLLAGGPSEIGSMRNVQLRRKDQIMTTFDLYNLLLKGDKSSDKILQAGDVVFVPVSGPLVGIAGNVKRPAIYELKDKIELQYLIDLSGGIIPTAYTQQIQIERIVKNEKQVIVDIDDKNLNKTRLVNLQDSDLVKIFSIVDADVNVVFLNGHVKKPGKYELKPGMKLREVVRDIDDLLPEPYLKYALIKRSFPVSREPLLIPFHLGHLLDGSDAGANIDLKPKDDIYIFSAWFFKDKSSFTVRGEVRNPDKYDLIRNSKVKDAILAAGGLTKEAYLDRAQILRVGKNRQYEQIIYFSVTRALDENDEDNIPLQEDDVVTIRSLSEVFYRQTVSAGGALAKPGNFEFAEKMTVKDLVFAAGNVLESAYLDAAELSSMVIDNGAIARMVTRDINLRKALAGDPEHNEELKPYDRLFVRNITDWRLERYITVSGQVRFSGKYMIQKGEKLSSVIERAGGYLDGAYLRGSVFTRERVRLDQQRSMEEMAARMEKDLLVTGTMKVSTSVSVEEVQAKQNEIVQKKKLIENIRSIKAKGRMTVKLAPLETLKGSEYDIALENGDELIIPERNNVVGVVGSVMGQGSHIFSEKADYQDYINMSGGYSDYADESNVFILKVDGSARKAKRGLLNWNRNPNHLETVVVSERDTYYVEPGDVIVVPEKFDRIAWLREIRDITQILMNTAVIAGVVKVLF